MTKPIAIALENVTKRYGEQVTVDRVTLEVESGELFVLLGASGSGKSTILRMIAGLLLADEGVVKLADRDVTRLSPQARDVGFVFQNYSIFRHMTVAQNIEFGLRIRRVAGARTASSDARSCWSSSGWEASAAVTRASSPGASGSAWPWRAPSPTSRRCFSSTSPSAPST